MKRCDHICEDFKNFYADRTCHRCRQTWEPLCPESADSVLRVASWLHIYTSIYSGNKVHGKSKALAPPAMDLLARITLVDHSRYYL